MADKKSREVLGGDERIGVPLRNPDGSTNRVGELSIEVNADMEDAIKGFKALQRELRETTKAARETSVALDDLNGRYIRLDGEEAVEDMPERKREDF